MVGEAVFRLPYTPMPLLDTNRQRAAVAVILLGVALAIALSPYTSGLIGGAVLYVLARPLNEILRRRLRPALAASVVTAIAVLLVIFPGVSIATLLVNEAQGIARDVIHGPALQRIAALQLGTFEVGPRLASIGEQLITWLGASAFSLIGTATRLVLNLTIAFFGLYFLCLAPERAWDLFRPYIPFSETNAETLRQRFRDVTNSTLIGIFLIALVQGVLVGTAFWLIGLDNALFWGTVTGLISIVPVIGSLVIWGPACIALAIDGRWPAAVFLVIWGGVIVASADNFIRPFVYRRWAQIHPMVTLVGAFAGIRYFGILGILIGPLALSYFFVLTRMYRDEFLEPVAPTAIPAPHSAVTE